MTPRLLLVAVLGACGSDVADVEPPGDYMMWTRVDTYGDTPGHGNTYRIIYVNDTAKATPRSYGMGSIIVKEVYNRADSGGVPGPGSLRVIELARRTGQPTDDDSGWLFSAASEPNGEETVGEFCWRRCHQAAPVDGMWFDYSKF